MSNTTKKKLTRKIRRLSEFAPSSFVASLLWVFWYPFLRACLWVTMLLLRYVGEDWGTK